jgi:hypothetical protein
MQTQILQPGPQILHYDAHHYIKPKHAVSAGTGISFQDYAGMHVQNRPQSSKHKPAPEWALDDRKLLELVATQMEYRALAFTAGDPKERIANAQAALEEKRPMLEAQLDRLCAEYASVKKVTPSNEGRLIRLRTLIQNTDTTLLILNRTAALMTAIVYLYWRARYDSVGVAEELRVRPPHVRTILCRLGQTWKRMQSPAFARWRDARINSEHVYGGYKRKKIVEIVELVYRPVPVTVICKLASEPRSLILWENKEVWIENDQLVHTGWRTGILQAVQLGRRLHLKPTTA